MEIELDHVRIMKYAKSIAAKLWKAYPVNNGGYDYDDICQHMLMYTYRRSYKLYKVDLGEFYTYIYQCMNYAGMRFINSHSRTIKIPEHIIGEYKVPDTYSLDLINADRDGEAAQIDQIDYRQSIFDKIIADDRKAELCALLRKTLDGVRLDIIIEHYINGLDRSEVCAKLNITHKIYGSQIIRALYTLRKNYKYLFEKLK